MTTLIGGLFAAFLLLQGCQAGYVDRTSRLMQQVEEEGTALFHRLGLIVLFLFPWFWLSLSLCVTELINKRIQSCTFWNNITAKSWAIILQFTIPLIRQENLIFVDWFYVTYTITHCESAERKPSSLTLRHAAREEWSSAAWSSTMVSLGVSTTPAAAAAQALSLPRQTVVPFFVRCLWSWVDNAFSKWLIQLPSLCGVVPASEAWHCSKDLVSVSQTIGLQIVYFVGNHFAIITL